MLSKNIGLGLVTITVLSLLGIVIITTLTDKRATENYVASLVQERDAWRTVGTIALRRLAYQDTLFADQALIVVAEHLPDIGLFRGGDMLAARELQVPVSQQGDRTFRLTFTPEGRVDEVRLLPLLPATQHPSADP